MIWKNELKVENLIKLSWLNKIFGKKQEENIEETKMSLKDVEDFIVNKLKKESEPLEESTKRQARKEYENLQQIASRMQNQLNLLKQAPYSGRNDAIIIRKAVGSRKSFVNKMEILIRQIQSPIEDDITSILDFHNETAGLINITNAKTVREYAFLKELFKDEGKKILETFHQIIEIDKKLGNIIKKFKKSNIELLEAKEIATEALKLTEELEHKNKIDELSNILKKTENKNKKIENELKKLLDSNEWKNFLEMKKTREQMIINLQNKRSDFIELIAKVEKPLKKYRWSIKNKILDDYIQQSFESILSEDSKGEIFISIIKKIKIDVSEGKMNLKNKDKFLTIIEKMIEDNSIEKMLVEYSKLSEDLKNQEKRLILEKIPKRKSDLESEINRLKVEIEEIENEEKRVQNQIKTIQADTKQKIKELEDLLNKITNKKILLKAN